MKTKYKILNCILAGVVVIMLFVVKIAVLISAGGSHTVTASDGTPMANIDVGRVYSFPLYGEGCMGMDVKTTNDRGRAYIPNSFVYVPLWRFMYFNIMYQCSQMCDCCLSSSGNYVVDESLPKFADMVATVNTTPVGESVYSTVIYTKKTVRGEPDWGDINIKQLQEESLALYGMGVTRSVPPNLWGELVKFRPTIVRVTTKSIRLEYFDDVNGYDIYPGKCPESDEKHKTPIHNVYRY